MVRPDRRRARFRHRACGPGVQQRGFEELDRLVLPVDLLDLTAVVDRRRTRRGRQELVRLLHLRTQLVDQLYPSGDQLRTVGGKVAVPHVERLGHRPVTAVPGACRRLEQSGALPQHLVVIGSDTRDPGSPRGGEFIEIPASLRGIPADQGQVFRGEHHRAQRAQHFARRPHRRAVQSGLVRSSGHHLQIDGELAAFVHHDCRDDGALGARPQKWRVRGNPVRSQCRRIPQCLNEIGLAIPVRSDEHGAAGLEVQVDLRP